MTEDQDLDLQFDASVLDQILLNAVLHDPLSNYPREQDHFIRYAPASEIQAWKTWNLSRKAALYNRFASNKQKTFRALGECPDYIYEILMLQDPLFWKNSKKRNAFYKRNPLFCIAEAV